MTTEIDSRETVLAALATFSQQPLRLAATQLLGSLGYSSDRTLNLGSSNPQAFLELVRSQASGSEFSEAKALFADWKSADLLFQLTDEELSRHASLFQDTTVHPGLLRSYVFFAIELNGGNYTRSKLTGIARQINRVFPMPVMVLIKHLVDKEPVLSITVINRRQHKRETSKDVLGKVTIIRDIRLTQPHRGHLDILSSFAFPNLVHPQRIPIDSFDNLHAAWEEIFNVELLNKRFYRELANWYFWALPQVDFPTDTEMDDERRRATSLIRLLTRLIFCWFLKEKGLVPEKLFVEVELKCILNDQSPDASTYHQAILQNLFFATLNQRMGKDKNGQPYRGFARDEGFQKNRATYGVDTLYRYEEHFRDPVAALDLFAEVPFLNGGLFECLDRVEDSTGKKLYVDGFSRNKKKRPTVPNRLFFADEQTVDLSDAYGEPKRKNEKVRGLLRILHSYKFTIVENTPIDQEIALDPELLGKVFENLLASYNEETKSTARKQTGSFYTPRPIVEYMVNASLTAHLTGALTKVGLAEADARTGLDILFAYTERQHPFLDREIAALLDAIHTCKILDPACGSGAFPMGMLQKLVYIIHKLDPDNARWQQIQIDAAATIPDSSAREAAIAAIERDFADNEDDYGRKLYLIENCLYGVDIQPIAIQISKLRFFISLVCDQRTNRSKRDNYGIRPLPNLETKFVAADTLIGLPEMEQMTLVPQRVYQIEAEIETLYHSHFAIQRRDQKLVVQRKIKDLRDELGKLLAESLMAPKKARHVADWDPFDPQATSDFFDPHWMFGRSLADGFDIVFGNPPWGAALSKEMKASLKESYPEIDSSTPNSFAYFVGAALRLAKSQIAYVLPDSILIKDYAKTRRILKDIVTRIDWYLNTGIPEQFRPFVYVEHDVCVLILDKTQSRSDCAITKHLFDTNSNEQYVDQRQVQKEMFILEHHDYCFNLRITQASHRLMKSLEMGTPLGKLTQCHEGIHSGNSRDVLFHDAKINSHCKPLFYGGRAGDRIENYHSTRAGWFVDYRESIIDKRKGLYASLRDERIFRLPKIYIARTGNPLKAFFDFDNYASNNFFSLQFKAYEKNTEGNLKAILPLILSSVANYYIRNFAAPRLGNTYIETKIIHLDRVPVSDALLRRSNQFARLTDLMISAIKCDVESVTGFLEDLIDACVMECYFLEHMAELDLLFLDDVAPHLVAFEPQASEGHQREFLTHLHLTLNAPTSKIRNRLLRLTSDSPDLLAVIKDEGRV
jgi:adenine-specific DNA-methyltransferase